MYIEGTNGILFYVKQNLNNTITQLQQSFRQRTIHFSRSFKRHISEKLSSQKEISFGLEEVTSKGDEIIILKNNTR